ncbi:hypothetical protein SCOR_01055 [Sulfidibacter corallicola]
MGFADFFTTESTEKTEEELLLRMMDWQFEEWKCLW